MENNFLLKTIKATLILHCQQQISCYKGFVAVGQLCTSVVLTPDEPPSPTTHAASLRAAAVLLRHVKENNQLLWSFADGTDSGQHPEKATKPTPRRINWL